MSSTLVSWSKNTTSTNPETNTRPKKCWTFANGSDTVCDSRIRKRDGNKLEKVVATPLVNTSQWTKGGALPSVKIHPMECMPKLSTVTEPKRKTRLAAYQARTICCPSAGAVEEPKRRLIHPKLPDYADIKARFSALKHTKVHNHTGLDAYAGHKTR